MNKKTLLILVSTVFFAALNAATLSPLPFLHLNNKVEKPVSEQIMENSFLWGGYYAGMESKEILKLKGRLQKVYNPCDVGFCGLQVLKGKYYPKEGELSFNGSKYTPMFSMSEDRLDELFLVRELPRKEYNLFKIRQDTGFGYFYNKTNLLKEAGNAPFYLRYCHNGNDYLGDKNYENVYQMYATCDKLFMNNLKKTNFMVEKEYQEVFFIENRGGFGEDSLFEMVQDRKTAYPFKRNFNVSITCSAFNYCVEVIRVKNDYPKFIDDNFMLYENSLLFKDLELLKNLDNERAKIHCNRDHKQEGLEKDEIEKRLLCDLRYTIFNENILYVLKVNQYNEKHLDFTGLMKYRNLHKIIEDKKSLLKSKKFIYTDYQRAELQLEIGEYEYLLSMIKIFPPKIVHGAYKRPTNEEAIENTYDEIELKAQIRHAEGELERYKQEKLQYKIDEEYTRIEELKRVLMLQY